MYNFIIIISFMIFIFFLSADKTISKEIIKKNSLHIILFLLLIYFIYNNLHLGFLLLIVLGVILYYTNFKIYILNNLQQYSIKNYFPTQLIDLISPNKSTPSITTSNITTSNITYEHSDINPEINSNIQESIRKIKKNDILEDVISEDNVYNIDNVDNEDNISENDRLNELMNQIHEELSN
jgi:hypothetical protein